MSAIDRLINNSVKCVKCGAAYGACRCWEKPASAPTHYTIRDREDREVARESTLARARNTARKYGPGSVVLGARNQVIYTVPPAKEPKS